MNRADAQVGHALTPVSQIWIERYILILVMLTSETSLWYHHFNECKYSTPFLRAPSSGVALA